jgi:hypothetical protein
MQFEIDDQTEQTSESTEPVAPGTSNYGFCNATDPCQFSVSSVFSFLF